MNKKFFTLLAVSCAAMAVNAQTITYDASGKVAAIATGLDAYTTKAVGDVDARFPYTVMGNEAVAAATTINKLENVDNGFEAKLFQLKDASGNLLAMQWNDKVNKYQLVLITPTAPYFIEETLWQVSASMVNESKALRYTFVNVGAQLPLQLPTAGAIGTIADHAFVTGSSITWTWSEVAENAAGLTGELTAAVDAQNSICLVAGSDGTIEVEKYARTGSPAGTALAFTAIEALPVPLKASEINAMMTGTKNGTKVQFSMSPEIAPDKANNPLTSGKFQAFNVVADGTSLNDVTKTYQVEAKNAYGTVTDNGYVVLAKEGNTKNLLRVDTVYHNTSLDARYELKLTTNEIEAPREAYVIGTKEYGASSTDRTKIANASIKAMYEQAQFRLQYYPSTQSVIAQAKQYLYLDKAAKQSWWKALVAANAGLDMANLNALFNSNSADYYPATADKAEIEYTTATTEAAAVTEIAAAATNTGKAKIFLSGTDIVTGAGNTGMATAQGDNWNYNLIKLTTLTTSPEHTEVTVGFDARDTEFKGIKTLIRIGDVFVSEEAADIKAGFYYVQNGNKVSTDLLKSGYWRYYDLAATNRTATTYADRSGKWVISENKTAQYEMPNVVYSADQLTKIPAAQWYFNGTAGAGFYTISNRESKDEMASSVYLWKVKENGVVVPNTYAMKGTVDPTKNDTIVVAPATIDPFDGYMNISEEVANADTTVFNFKFSTLGSDPMTVGVNNDILTVLNGEAIDFKVERVQIQDKDEFTGDDVVYTDDLIYGMNTTKKDTLRRALYRIYKEDVSANSTEGTGKRTREYITLDGGQYKLQSYVITVDEKGYTSYNKDDNNGKADNRKYFYIKNVTNTDNEFVLVDPTTTNTADNKIGVRAFVNQVTGILQPAGLKSQGASNVFDASVFTFAKITKYNYRDIRREGIARDTVILFKDGNPAIKLYESSAKSANISLLARDNKEQFTKNFAFFVDTANVDNADMPIFLLGLRPVDDEEISSIPSHNKHLSTTADYLMVLTDSAAINPAYKDIKGNIRLGFVNATHFADCTLKLTNSDKTFDLSKKALTPATFAFRYVDKSRDAFYIETADVDGKPAWVKVINEVPVIVKDIKEAEIYNVEATSETPTANDEITATEVSVETIPGAVVVKNAAGKTVTVSTILGQNVATKVLSSDKETIAVPAGIVVVAIDGADAVKAIVK